ncbi:MAG: glycosyltransferase family 87 protein [bacterium]|nr:glycosyltransferase family 87 protein [bacterium]
MSNKRVKTLLFLVVTCFLVRIIPASFIYGTEDIRDWLTLAKDIGSNINIYTEEFYHFTPLWAYICYFMCKLSSLIRVPHFVMVKLPGIISDVLLSLAVYDAMSRLGKKAMKIALCGVVLNPILIITSTIWGQLDSVIILFVFLSWYLVYFTNRFCNVWLSGLCLGIGIALKIYPLILIPAFLSKIKKKHWLSFTVLTVLPTIISIFIYRIKYPINIRFIFSYSGYFHWWGYYAVLTVLKNIFGNPLWLKKVMTFFFLYSKYFLIIAIPFVWHRVFTKSNLSFSIIFSYVTFYVTQVKVAPYYMIWLFPFLAMRKYREVKSLWWFSILFVLIGSLHTNVWDIRFRGHYGVPFVKPIALSDIAFKSLFSMTLLFGFLTWLCFLKWWVITFKK